MLVRWNSTRDLRRGFMAGFVLYGGLVCFPGVAMLLKWPVLTRMWTDTVGARFLPGDMMPQLFHGGFFLTAWIAVIVVTLVIMLILVSVIGKLARHERMFWRKRR
jgi:hypothetical protein